MSLENQKCVCQEPYHGPRDGLLERLEAVREECPAIKLVFLPDDVWTDYQDWHQQRDLGLQSILLVALYYGLLGRVTSAIHHFLINDGRLRSGVEKQYRQDLRETWWQASSQLGRHQQRRIFLGRLAELNFAEMLEQQGWSIDNLEAWGAKVDIAASTNEGRPTSFEVKYIGTEDEDFKTLQKAMENEGGAGTVNGYTAINYVQFKVYEAALQLESVRSRRIAVIIISDWWRFRHSLPEKWVDWNKPHLYPGDSTWKKFLKTPRIIKKYPDLHDNLSDKINALDEIWILEWTADFEFVLKYKELIKTF